jgi:hypothetical protein
MSGFNRPAEASVVRGAIPKHGLRTSHVCGVQEAAREKVKLPKHLGDRKCIDEAAIEGHNVVPERSSFEAVSPSSR